MLSISPLLFFVVFYLGTSILVGDFYKVPITVAFLFTSIYAITVIGKGKLTERMQTFSRGAGTPNMMLMLWIFILAGAFASSAKAMGSIDSTVNFTLNFLPDNMLLPGLFLAACFISLSIGTSVGTIVALVPIAAGIANGTGQSTAFVTAVVVGGAFFGDNLSFISDTTIVATQTQGCKMSDKFKANIYIVAPAALSILLLYIILGINIHETSPIHDYNLIKILPYLVVLITAIFGLNVMVVLPIGIILTGIIGICDGSYDLFGWMKCMGDGIMSMGELVIVTLLAGGLLETIREAGGIKYIITKMTKRINGKRGAEISIGMLVAMVDICTANNTVAIITVGDISHQISEKYGVDPRKAASILDTFSCCIQGLIPYGAQLLMAAGIATISPVEIIPYLYYPMALGAIAIMAILFRFPKKYS